MLFLDAFDRLGSLELLAALLFLGYLARDKVLGKTSLPNNAGTSQGGKGEVGDARSLLHKIETDHKNCIIFFGSQTGTAEGFAGRLAKEGKSRFGLETMVANLEDYDLKDLDALPEDTVAFFILATYGEGEPTDNAAEFYDLITSKDPSFSTGSSLSNLNYIAFGLGNKTYENYNAVVHRVTQALDDLGALRIGETGEADDNAGTSEEDFLAWKENMWAALASKMNLEETETSYEPSFRITECNHLSRESRQVYLGEMNELHLHAKAESLQGPFDLHNPYVAPITKSWELFPSTVRDRKCVHLDIDISGTGLSYETGDHMAVWPTNASAEVDRLLYILGLDEKRHHVVNVESLDPGAKVPLPTPTTYDTMLRYYLEICGPISRQLISDIIPFAPDEASRKKLEAISNDKHLFQSESHFSNLARLLGRISCGQRWSKIPLSLLVEGLPKLQHRFYSISSSPLVQPNTVSITVAVKSEVVPGISESETFCGVASNFLLALHSARVGDTPPRCSYDVGGPRQHYDGHRVPVHIRHSSFRLPSDPLRPVIMVGPGTGVAPFRGFAQERVEMARKGRNTGTMMLFFGCRKRDEDFLYEQEWTVSLVYIIGSLLTIRGDRLIQAILRNTKRS